MRRKVIQLAEKTLVVSLPSKWVNEWSVQKGDELDFSDNGPKLTISTENNRAVYRCSVNIENTSERALRWMLSSLHKKGYDELELMTVDSSQEKIIDELLKDLFIGFTLVHRSPQRCVVRAIAKDSPQEFDAVLRRAFLVTLSMGEQISDLLVSGELDKLKDIKQMEKTNNQLTNFCERSLNKRGEPLKSTFLYVIVWNLEKIADDYKYLCDALVDTKQFKSSMISLLKEVNLILRSYYELFYKFELQKLSELSEKIKKLRTRIETEMHNNPILLSHLLHILMKTADFSASIYALNT